MRSSLRDIFARLLIAGGILGAGTAMAQDRSSHVAAYSNHGAHANHSSMGNHHGNNHGWNSHGNHYGSNHYGNNQGWNHYGNSHGWNHHHHHHGWHHHHHHSHHGGGYGGDGYNSGYSSNSNSGNGYGVQGASVSWDARTQTMTSSGSTAGVMYNGTTHQSYAWGPNQPMTVISSPSGITAYPTLNVGSGTTSYSHNVSSSGSHSGSHSQQHHR